jgi:hypothetical protein
MISMGCDAILKNKQFVMGDVRCYCRAAIDVFLTYRHFTQCG